MSSQETTTPQAKKKSSRSWCCAYGCSSNPEKCPDLAFHRFPNEKRAETRNAWVKAVRRQDWTPTSSSVLCSGHFQKDCYKIPPGIGRKPMLKSDAIPSIFTAYPTYLQPKAVKRWTPTIRTESLLKRGRTPQTAASTIIPDPENSTPGDTTIHDDEQLAASDNQDTPTASTTSCRCGGRPKQPAVTRISILKRRIKTLQQRVGQLEQKNRIQNNLITILRKDNKFDNIELTSMDGCLGELLSNETTNKAILNVLS
ncbi:THAP domain-containing protein 1-like [Watersipora subatra]|uniref:THAP domain-containing protein 1-like n=1 Tax=Watersipora subatra TaxID=2589382 RepID=UPI00355B30B7